MATTTTTTVTQADIDAARTFLTTYMSNAIPEADYTPGNAVTDFAIDAISRVFAFLRGEIVLSRNMQSVLGLSQLPASVDKDQAANAALSNLFLTRNPGRPAHTLCRVHLSKQADTAIAGTTRFFRTQALVYFPDTAGTTFTVGASQMSPTISSDGTVTDYTFTVALVASGIGTAYNQPTGRFSSVDAFSPYFLYAESISDASDGRDIQTTTQMLANAPNALSTRNLVNTKSITQVLTDTYSDISRVVVVGAGDPEMIRDYVTELGTNLAVHAGGAYDAFVDLPRTDDTELLVVGALFARPDNLITILRDPAGFAGVAPGAILRVSVGLVDVPRTYIITAVGADFVQVNDRTPFSAATDEAGAYVTYQIGYYYPNFSDVILNRTTGQTSRKQGHIGRVTLTGQPQYKIKSVEIIDGSTVTEMGPRVNGTPTGLEYQVITQNPASAQSQFAVTEIVLADGSYDTKQMRVTYETLTDYQLVQNTLVAAFTRTVSASTLARGLHSTYLSMTVIYDIEPTATAPDPAAVATAIAGFVNSFPSTTTINMSTISKFLFKTYDGIISCVYPFAIYYTLNAPDGQQYEYATTDGVRVFPDETPGAQLMNGADLRVPLPDCSIANVPANAARIAAANAQLRYQLNQLGISDRVVRYFTDSTDITCAVRGV